jgi:hypothetical protein
MSFHKHLVIHVSNQPYHFQFEIVKEYRSIRFANGKEVSGHGFFIRVHQSPKQQQYLNDGEFHFIASTHPPLICWDTLITRFEDARQVMFQWAKNYAQRVHHLHRSRPSPAHRSPAPSHSYWFEELRASIRQDQYRRIAFQTSIPGRLIRWVKQKITRS